MTLKKLLNLLLELAALDHMNDLKFHGSHLHTTSGGELTISFNTQPSIAIHAFLRRQGFIHWEGDYIYRPRARSRKAS